MISTNDKKCSVTRSCNFSVSLKKALNKTNLYNNNDKLTTGYEVNILMQNNKTSFLQNTNFCL